MPPRKPTGEGGTSRTPSDRSRRRLSKKTLEALVEDATVDAHDESEQTIGLYTMIDEHVSLPLQTTVLGVEVTVDKLDVTERGDIVARCRRGSERQWVPILELPLPDPPPHGWEWIEAYRYWARGWR
jgi:hypothetical protein